MNYMDYVDPVSEKLQIEGWDEPSGTLNTVCPFCGKPNFHFAINFKKGVYNCFRCGEHGHIVTLLRKLGLSNYDTSINLKQSQSISDLVGILTESTTVPQISLQDYYNSISTELNLLHYNYLISRGLSMQEISLYKFKSGKLNTKYFGYVIIPCYNLSGDLCYFNARNTIDGKLKYRNPPSEVAGLNGSVFNINNINTPYLFVTEGVFTCMAVNRYLGKQCAVAIYGKGFKQKTLDTLVAKEISRYYICLDSDALNETLEWADKLSSLGKDVYICKIPEVNGLHTDVADLTKEEFLHVVEESSSYSRLSTLKVLKGGLDVI